MTKKNTQPKETNEVNETNEMIKLQTLNQALTEENEQLIKDTEQMTKKTEQYLSQISILKKDFDNFKRRSSETLQNAKDEGAVVIVEKLLPVLDTFDRAAQMVKEQSTIEALNLVKKQFQKALSEAGVVEIDCLNTPFDPNFADALLKVEVDEDKKGLIIEVLAKGYMLGERIIRHAQVSVGV